MALTSDMGMPRTLSSGMFPTLSPTAINSGNTTGNTGMAQTPPSSWGDALTQPRQLTSVTPPKPVAQTGFLGNLVSAFPKLSGGSSSIAAPYSGGTQSDANSTGGYAQPAGANTAGGGGTLSDANSTPGGVGYGAPDIPKLDADFLQKQLNGDQQFQYDLTNISGQQRNAMDALTALATQNEIASGFAFDPNQAAKLGFKMPGSFTDAMGNTIDASQALSAALSGANGLAQSNPYSTNAQIQTAYSKLLNQQDAAMVAHGMGRSGDFQDSSGQYTGGYQHEAATYQQQLAQYNAMQDFLGKLSGGENDLTNTMSKSFDSISTARSNALNRILALINAGALTLPSKNTPPATQPPLPPGLATPPAHVAAPSLQNPNPAISAVAGSGGGAAGDVAGNVRDFLTGNTNPSQIAAQGGMQGAGAVGNDVLSMLGGNQQQPALPSWMTNGGWGSFGWGGGAPGTSGGDDGSSYSTPDYTPVPIPDTGTVLSNAQNAWMANTPDPNAVYRQYGLSPGIGLWRT